MKRKMVILLWVILLGACGNFAQPQNGSFQNDFGFNPGDGSDGAEFEIVGLLLNLFPTFAIPNSIVIQGDIAYIVNSGTNNIQRLNLATSTDLGIFANLPAGSNPWEMAIQGNRGYVSNFVANTVSVIDLTSGGGPIATINATALGGFASPEGIAAAANGLVFVANTNLDFSSGVGVYHPGFVTVIDTATNLVVNEIPTTQNNPQVVEVIGNTVYVVNSGEGVFDFGCFCFKPVTGGGVDIIDATQARTANSPNANVPIPLDISQPSRGLPGSFTFTADNRFAYLGSNTGILYKIDLLSRTLVRGNSNPIVVTPDATDNLVNAKIDDKGVIWILSFNQDGLYLLNPANDQVDPNFISLNTDPNALEGPLDLDFRNAGEFPDVYVLMTVSEEVSAVITN